MKRMKALSLITIAAMMGTVLAACGGGASPGSSGSSSGSSSSGSSSNSSSSGSTATSEPTKEQKEVVTLKLSHQWPQATADSGDFRGQLAVRFADEVEKRTNGSVKVEIYPASQLVKSTQQWDAIQQGALDLSVFPLDYASGKVPQFDITLMPAIVKSHAQAQAWQNAEIGKKIEEITDKHGVKILTWVWNAGGIGGKGDPIIRPSDVKPGAKMRAAGKRVEAMLQAAGAGITSMASSEIYSSMQTGVLDAAITSASSFGSYKLQEQIDSYVSPTKNTFWFMFEPLIIGKKALEKLTPEQQQAIIDAGASVQEFAYKASEEDDLAVEKLFKDAGVNVVQMDDAAYEEWHELAKQVWDDFATKTEGGQELIDLAQKVQ